MDGGRPVLVGENDPTDVAFLKKALQEGRMATRVAIVQDGQAFIDYLTQQGPFAATKWPLPSIIFLNLKIPKMSGLEVLRFLKRHETFRSIPTFVFTSSNLDGDVQEAYGLGANGYLVKPTEPAAYAKRVIETFEFWSMCSVPPTAG